MSYALAIDQLNSMVPELHTRPGQPRRKFSLEEVKTLLGELGDPHQRFRSVLIAGTNGKGSTAATLASILHASGQRVGLYTSPHLEKPNERIRIGSAEICDDLFARLYFLVKEAAEKLIAENKLPQSPSYFEVLTAIAFLYYAEQRVDLAVLEVGMGGRLDATNVVDPLLSIITDISLDHMEWLGPTIAAITREKAGILRDGGVMITLPQHPEANQVLGEIATSLGVRGVNAGLYVPGSAFGNAYSVDVLGETIEVDSPLIGAHQHRNVALAIAAAVELRESHGFPITPRSIAVGTRSTYWPGRLERISSGDIEWILDVAHNPAGAWALRGGLRSILKEGNPRVLVFSCLRDKPLAEMAQILFPVFEQVVIAPIHATRAAEMDDLAAAAQETGTRFRKANSVADAMSAAQELARSGTAVVSGSVYLVGEARSWLLHRKEGA
jgi:dihydrofolate synthase/folylpolyglutamate synthase